MIVRAWVATPDVASARSDLLERIKSSLGDGGFKAPYPRMRLEHPPQAAK
jgi:small-conductance mechanosensitive channel